MNARYAAVAALVFAALAPTLPAQCANGSSAPCVPPRVAVQRDPNLDTLMWIVLPFRNVARATDLDWVSSSSVDLLYIDMSRWTDLHVVDDERVRDLLRGVPEAMRSQLGLDSVRAIARHAGAGRLVMGDFLKSGARTIVTAKVFNTLTGQRVRQVIDTAETAEAIPSTFSRLAASVLAVPPPPGTTLNGLGTRSAGAVREYTLGLQAFNRWRMDSAEMHFRRALDFDSTFALVHLRLATVDGQTARAADAVRERAAATQYAAGLPAREQLVIAARQLKLDRAAICTLAGGLLALDSADSEGWLAMGNCHQAAGPAVVGAGGRVTPAQNWNAARRAFERGLGSLQPDRWDLFQALMDLYRLPVRRVCLVSVPEGTACPTQSEYWAANVLEGDSMVARFERVDPVDWPGRRRESDPGRRAMESVANDLAAMWASANPRALNGRVWYAGWQLTLGNLAGAERELAATAELGQMSWNSKNRNVWYTWSAELALRSMRPERVFPLLDSLMPGSATSGFSTGMLMTVTGQFHRDDAVVVVDARWVPRDTSPVVRALRASFMPVYAGVVAADFERTIKAYADTWPEQRDTILDVGRLLAFHALRTAPAIDTASSFPLLRFQAFLARADTVSARRALAQYDAWGDAGVETCLDAHEMFSAESHLELRDTLAAWTRIEPFARRWAGYAFASANSNCTFRGGASSNGFFSALRTSGRAWLLYADLAMATGHRDEAKRGYTMIVGMWAKGDPPVQPLVTRAKEALVKLGGP